MNSQLLTLSYLVASVCFVMGIKRLSTVRTARSGNIVASIGMLIAVLATVAHETSLSWGVMIAGMVVGGGIGAVLSVRVPFTAMPELVAAFNGFGGGASAFVAFTELGGETALADHFFGSTYAIAVAASIMIGSLTLTGSGVAYLKLRGSKLTHPLQGAARHGLHLAIAIVAIACCFWLANATGFAVVFPAIIVCASAATLGVLLVLPIGGADMPVVVSLLNSYSGLAAAATGFVLANQLLAVAGALVGASGLILTRIMCKAMNRSLGNVLIGGIGDDAGEGDRSGYTGVKESSAEEVAMLFDAADSVIFVPGYGLAVAQAQHLVRELAEKLHKRGVKVRYAIHPVAGRMPGHMNVLLAEADVPYDQLFELDQINSDFRQTDLVMVIGANDVVNPVANTDPTSPIAGMPVLHVWEARTVIVVKRSLSPGYAGIKNPLFEAENTVMFFADAKEGLQKVLAEMD
ncbi:MAG: NAD(P)(+) transhydrogenase (Re/Si-specific) subunit beta [Planctomycetota bacterium]